MLLWRLSGARYANVFDGGYGLANEGRWNSIGRPVTYCSSSPALCLLEKLVHIEDPTLLPELVLIAYAVPDKLRTDEVALADLPADWPRKESTTQGLGDSWLESTTAPILRVPTVIVPVLGSTDHNYLINHRHPDIRHVRSVRAEPFTLDLRLVRV